MSQHRLPIHRDNLSFDERTDRMMRDVRRRMDEDLQRFGFGRHGLTSSLFSKSRMGDPWATTSLRADEDDSLFPSHDFFQLRPSLGGRSGTSSPRKEEFGSRESLDDETTRKCYHPAASGSGTDGQANGGDSRVFSMNFDVKDYSAEDISVTVEDETLIVQAKKRIEKDGSVSSKEFSRKIRIPPDVDPEKLSSTLTSDGILTVEAPAPPKYVTDGQSAASLSASPAQLEKDIPLDTPIFSAPSNGSGGRRSMTLRLEVGKPYTPDDIVVKLEGRKLFIEAVHEEKAQGRTSRSSMQRDFDLSEDIDLGTVKALLKDNGQLTITALV